MKQQRKTVTYTQKYSPIAYRYLQPLTYGNLFELFNNIIEDIQFHLIFSRVPRENRPPSPLEEMREGELERTLPEPMPKNWKHPQDALAYESDPERM